jgi:hypothetical protein
MPNANGSISEMPDCPCNGLGFVPNGDYVDHKGKAHKHASSVKRCPEYVEYFKSIADMAGAQVISGPGVCPAASARHELVRHREQTKSDRGRGRF